MKLEEKVGELLKAKKLSLSTAESCTGGGISALITSVPGSSEYFNGGIVAYSNEIKMSLLHVSAETLEKHGAVSRETVTEMVKGAMKTLKTEAEMRKKCYHTVNYFKKNLFGNDKSAYFALCLK